MPPVDFQFCAFYLFSLLFTATSRSRRRRVILFHQHRERSANIHVKKKRDPFLGEKEIFEASKKYLVLIDGSARSLTSTHLPSLAVQCCLVITLPRIQINSAEKKYRVEEEEKDIFMIDVGIFVCCLFFDLSLDNIKLLLFYVFLPSSASLHLPFFPILRPPVNHFHLFHYILR